MGVCRKEREGSAKIASLSKPAFDLAANGPRHTLC